MELNRVLVVYKADVGKRGQWGGGGPEARRRLAAISRLHRASLAQAVKSLERLRIPYRIVDRDKMSWPYRDDLILTVGGDGTVLAAVHRARGLPVLGLNSMPGHAVGFFCTATAKNIGRLLKGIARGTRRPRRLPLIEARIGKRLIRHLALNDILFAGSSPAEMVRYRIRVGRRQESQRSSGIWIAAGPGSTAAMHSAGGQRLGLNSSRLQYVVREPYHPRGRAAYRLKRGVLREGQSLSITSEMSQAMIYIDGPKLTYPVPFGDTFTATVGKRHVNIFL
jgi:NAD+ kinase